MHDLEKAKNFFLCDEGLLIAPHEKFDLKKSVPWESSMIKSNATCHHSIHIYLSNNTKIGEIKKSKFRESFFRI